MPAPPASMYIRPTHIGTEPAIGKAAAPSASSVQYVLLSPVGDYFAGGEAALRLLLEGSGGRCAPDHGMVKGGGNYASALKHIERAKAEVGADQVLFCPDGDVQETGAANFLLLDGDTLITKALDESFLHGVTRASLLTLARDAGYAVEERDLLGRGASRAGRAARRRGGAQRHRRGARRRRHARSRGPRARGRDRCAGPEAARAARGTQRHPVGTGRRPHGWVTRLETAA